MRLRHLAALSLLALLSGTLSPAVPAAAAPGADRDGREVHARDVLAEATALLTGEPATAARGAESARPDATLLLRDLDAALPDLAPADRRAARSLLARPTDGQADPQAQGYTTRSVRRCQGPVCVHSVRRTDDRATRAWVGTTLRTMREVWSKEVGGLGYRAPVSDAGLRRSQNGGDGRFDVYLANLGASSLYGYCAADFRLRAEPRRAGGYCVLDNDFSSEEFGRPPEETLAVTAAHEFFHAIQFGYDYDEDRWFMESTATWMEERFADDVDDNRQYLAYGQVKVPDTSLDLFDRGGFTHYGNWPFWEYLTERYDARLVRTTWEEARGRTYSTQALGRVLAEHGGLVKRYADFAAGNLTPSRTYREGAHWPTSIPEATWTFAADAADREDRVEIDHLASASYVLQPAATLTGDGWRMEVAIDGPDRDSSPTAWVVVRTVDGEWDSRQVRLDGRGRAALRLPFSADDVRAVSVTLVNASNRYRCDQDTPSWSCQGIPRDENKPFTIQATLSQR